MERIEQMTNVKEIPPICILNKGLTKNEEIPINHYDKKSNGKKWAKDINKEPTPKANKPVERIVYLLVIRKMQIRIMQYHFMPNKLQKNLLENAKCSWQVYRLISRRSASIWKHLIR